MSITSASSPRTKIINGTIIAFDGQEHRILEDGVLVFAGNTITHVGKSYDGPSERTIDARGKLIVPGQISTHSHVAIQEGSRAALDGGREEFSRASFLNFLPTKLEGGSTYIEDRDDIASLRYGMASLLRHGVTTVVNFAPGGIQAGNIIANLAVEFGLRLYYSPVATSGSYHMSAKGRLHERWDEATGMKSLDTALAFIEQLTPAQKQVVTPIVIVDEAYFATPALLKRARAAATQLGLRLSLHTAEQLYEFHDAIRKRGKTPVGILAEEGILGPDVILAHCFYVSGHSATGYPYCSGSSWLHVRKLSALFRSRDQHCTRNRFLSTRYDWRDASRRSNGKVSRPAL
jgi:5-methylthioadenosine/S-adenosylhomocysteine deaminase